MENREDEKRKEKIAVSCSIQAGNVISAPDIDSVYDIPLNFEKDKLGEIILKTLHLRKKSDTGLVKWRGFVDSIKKAKKEVRIAVVGKYFDTGDFVLSDSYLSVIEAIKFSAYHQHVKPEIDWINAKEIQDGTLALSSLEKYDGILVPGGFGETGIEGKINVIRYARENKIPYFGLCYGMQLLVIEYARNVAGLQGAERGRVAR